MPSRGPEAPDALSLSGRERLALAGLTLAALALRLVDLDRFPLWADEGATWWYARLIADGRLMEGIRLEPTPPLYYLLVAAATWALGPSDWAMRLPSAVFGAVSIPVALLLVRTLARSLDGRLVRYGSWTAAILLAVHPLHVFYSREARVYPLLLLLCMVLWISLRRALDEPVGGPIDPDDTRRWLAVSALLLVIAYLHYYSLFVFATAGLLVLALAPTARRRLRGLAAVVVPGLLFLPYVALTLPHLRESGAAWSIDALYEIFPGDRSFFRVLEMGMVGADYPVYLRQIAVPPMAGWLRWAAVAVQVALLVLALRYFVRKGDARGRRDLAFWLVAWLVPLLLPWAVTHGFRAIFHPGRHDVYGLWGLLFGVGLGVGGLLASGAGRRLLATGAVLVLLLATGGRLALLHVAPADESVRERAAWIAPHLQAAEQDPEAVVWTLGVQRLLTERYLRLERPELAEVPISSFPASTDSHPGWVDAAALMEDQGAILEEAARRVSELDADVEHVFVLTAGAPPGPDGGLTAQAWIDTALLRALERSGWRADPELSRRELDLLAFRRR